MKTATFEVDYEDDDFFIYVYDAEGRELVQMFLTKDQAARLARDLENNVEDYLLEQHGMN